MRASASGRLRPADFAGTESNRLCAIYGSDCFHSVHSLRNARNEQTRVAGLRRAKLRPADGLRHRNPAARTWDRRFSPQPSRGACDVRSREAALRGGGLRPTDVCDVEPCGIVDSKLLYDHTAYRDAACEGTRYAGLRGAKLRPAALACDSLSAIRQGAAAGCRAVARICSRGRTCGGAATQNPVSTRAAAGCHTYVRIFLGSKPAKELRQNKTALQWQAATGQRSLPLGLQTANDMRRTRDPLPDKKGNAPGRIPFRIPDHAARYSVAASAVGGGGQAEAATSSVTAL